MSESNFGNLNSDMNEHLAKGESFILRLPPDKMKIFVEKKYDILGESVKMLLSDPVKAKSVKSK